jgi:hypothetical protein
MINSLAPDIAQELKDQRNFKKNVDRVESTRTENAYIDHHIETNESFQMSLSLNMFQDN